MSGPSDPYRHPRLILEPSSGTATIDGEGIELPQKELQVLVELAARPGEVVATSELIEAVWPGVPGMTSDDLYTHVSRLRRRIRDGKGRPPLIRNRRGFGYYLDLPPNEVRVIGAADPVDAEIVAHQQWVVEEPTEPHRTAAPLETEPAPPESAELARPRLTHRWGRRGPLVAPLAVVVVVGLVATSWAVGFELSRRRAPEPAPSPSPSPRVVLPPSPAAAEEDRDRPTRRQRASQRARRQQARGGAATTTRIPPAAQAEQQASGNGTGAPRRSPAKSRQQPKLPPPPTSLLYHLYNADKDDHFVTTDGNVARQQEGRGYEGGAIARVYTYREENTKPIATNHGAAYIFISPSAKTDPPSKTTELYYTTDNAGDFFYTTRRSLAEKEGWESWVIGYVRTL